jgi:hypothetical protein
MPAKYLGNYFLYSVFMVSICFYDYLPVGSYASCNLNFIFFIYEIHKDA